ncbi:MAG: MBL fold metallo-hydrolase [bacterium]
MKLTFHGAAGEVTGSKTLIEAAGRRILLDCGLIQGEGSDRRNRAAWPFDPKSLDAVVVTHAHLDHIGLLPRLVRDGYGGPVFSTAPTREISRLMWEDEAKVRDEDAAAGAEPLFVSADIDETFGRIRGVGYGETVRVAPGVDVRFREAGHVLGSSFVELQADGLTLVGSGDIGNDNVPILRDTEPIGRADAVIMESTYGDRNHEGDESDRREVLRQAVAETVAGRAVLMIPAFSLERTQEILYELNGLVEGGSLPRVPIFLDSPLATGLLPIYRKHSECYDTEAKMLRQSGDDFFRFPGLRIMHGYRESLGIDRVRPPKVIIAGSGMMSGGRIVRHLARYLGDPANTLLVIGFQGQGTLGRRIVERSESIVIDGQTVHVRAKVNQIEAFSAHADRDKLLRWLGSSGGVASGKVFLNHGEPEAAESLATAIREKQLAEEVTVAAPEQTYEI